MNFASDEEELRFLSIFAKTEEMSSIDIASKQMREREEKTKNATKNATQQLTSNYRKNQKVKGAEKQRLAQFEVTNQGYASALHLHRNQNALNRASRDEVDEYSRRTAPTAGLPTAVVKGDKVETQYGAGVVQEVRNNGSDLLVALKFGTIHLPTKSLINYGIGPAVPISLESAYQRAKAMYTGGQIKEALAVWMQGVKMLQSRKNPPCAALASYLAAASQAERSLGLTRKALNHASEALRYARKENTASTKTLVERLEKTVAMIKTDLGEIVEENTYNFGQGIATEEYLEMDPEALETVQDAIRSAVKGDATTLKQLLQMSEMLGNKDYSRGISRAATETTKITALMVASAYGQVEVVKQLVRMGGNVNAKDHQGFTCLVWACRANQIEMATILLSNLNAPWVQPSSNASKEIQDLLNNIPQSERVASGRGSSNKTKTTTSTNHNKGKKKNQNQNHKNKNNNKNNNKNKKINNQKKESKPKQRNLKAWAPSNDEKDMKVKGLDNKVDKNYDQFAANSKLGVKGQAYDENVYTTKLSKTTKAGEEKANQLAKEIMKSKNAKKNKQADPEDQHSAVVTSKKKGNKNNSGSDGFTDADVKKKSVAKKKK